MFMNVDRIEPSLRPTADFVESDLLEDVWIRSRLNRTAKDVNEALGSYRFHETANRIYDFFWGDFCDWYIELIKGRLNAEDPAGKESALVACRNLLNIFEASLRLLHPVMPFITEEIWQAIYDGKPPFKSVALAAYPQADEKQFDLAVETNMAILQDLIVSVRNLRAELKIEPKTKVPIQLFAHDAETRVLIQQNEDAVKRLANVATITAVEQSAATQAPSRGTSRFDLRVIYEKQIDVAAECERLKKELEKIEKEIGNGQRQLSNEQFLAKAPTHVVEGIRKRAGELEVLRGKSRSKLDELGCE